MSLNSNGAAVAHAARVDSPPSPNAPLVQSPSLDGLLYQGLGGSPSAYLWTEPLGASQTDHLYLTEVLRPTYLTPVLG